MKKLFLSFYLLSLSAAVWAQNAVRVFKVDNFNRLDLGSAFKINVTKGPFKVEAEGNQEYLDELEYAVREGELSIKPKSKVRLWNNNRKITLTIQMPSLRAVDFSGAVDASVKGFTSRSINIDVSGASSAVFDISAGQVNVDGSGASSVVLKGDADKLIVDISGASDLKASNFTVAEANVEASGASDAHLNVSKKLVANASGASDIRYRGRASLSKNTSGASSVKGED